MGNSRIIKFRVWDVKSECFLNWDEIKKSNSIFIWINANNRKDESIVLQQYTGFKDCNGVEIYEGDILSSVFSTCDPDDHRYDNCKVFYNEGCFSIYLSEDYQPCLWEIDDSMCEVIGNIYNNPELKEEK